MIDFGQEERDAAARVLASGKLFRYLHGAEEAARFEVELGARLGSCHAVLVSSGTAALICSLAAVGIGPGDEVLVPAYGFIAVPLAVLAVGAVPVVCEIDDSLTLDPRDAANRIGRRTRAVLPVHMNGLPCAMKELCNLARERGLYLIEDACQAVGGAYHGRPLGTLGVAGAFSFNQHKILTAGEGGAVVTGDATLYERAFICHDGSCGNSEFRFREPLFAGLAFRASEMTAAILRVQLAKLDRILGSLRASRDQVLELLGESRRRVRAPGHDRAGECGTHVAYSFATATAAAEFCRLAEEAGLEAARGNLHWHSYAEWSLLHERRGAHHPLANPLRTTDRQFAPQDLPRTRAILDRTALLKCQPAAPPSGLAALRARLAKAGL